MMATATVRELGAGDFEQATRNGVSVVDFWAPWCGPCRMMAPVLDALADDYGDTVLVAKVNVDDHPGLAASFGVMSIPAVFVLSDGEVVRQFVGVQGKDALARVIDEQVVGSRS
jgi:thioredoxin 1